MTRATEVRAIIAGVDPADPECHVGDIELRVHQRQAVARLRAITSRAGGALLADDAGLGKTYVAAALAQDSASPIVVAPAALRPMWNAALASTHVVAAFVSFEGLSRGAVPAAKHDFVIVDEAHHARNPATKRYRAVATLTAHAKVLLLSATPIHNRRSDLEALLALFLGERASRMSDVELMHHVVRRERDAVDLTMRPPEAAAPRLLRLRHDEALLMELLALPPPLPPADGADGGVLLTHSLVRQWASSEGALRAALDRRSARAAALMAALSEGRYPTRGELRQWTFGDGAVQLAFPELMASTTTGDGAALIAAVRKHAHAVDALRIAVRTRPSLDSERAERIRQVRAEHPDEKIVAFTAYADTAWALYRELRMDIGVAVLTAAGGRVAGGALTRRETIDRFAPLAQRVRPPRAAERIDLLLATDLLSEGMNLQDASVVIHVDLPWTPARLEQRVGRAARIGSRHSRVTVYALSPPASAERLIAVERRLREKLSVARQAIGVGSPVLPPTADWGFAPAYDPVPGVAAPGRGGADGPSAAETVRKVMARWRANAAVAAVSAQGGTIRPSPAPGGDERPVGYPVAAVRAPGDGFLAAIAQPSGHTLLAGLDGVITTQLVALSEVISIADGKECEVDTVALRSAAGAIARWLRAERASAWAGMEGPAASRRGLFARIAAIARRAPAHRRPGIAVLATQARQAAATSAGAGAERELAELESAVLGDEEWLEAVRSWSARAGHGKDFPQGDAEVAELPRILGLLLLQRDGASD